jgi:hypothetical protein
MTREVPVKASRTRKCRHQHLCAICSRPVLVGQAEGLIGGKGWAHVQPCILGGQS